MRMDLSTRQQPKASSTEEAPACPSPELILKKAVFDIWPFSNRDVKKKVLSFAERSVRTDVSPGRTWRGKHRTGEEYYNSEHLKEVGCSYKGQRSENVIFISQSGREMQKIYLLDLCDHKINAPVL